MILEYSKEEKDFLKQLNGFSEDIKIKAYAILLQRFLVEIRSSSFNSDETSVMADLLHNIPLRMIDKEHYSDELIWCGDYKESQYLMDLLKKEFLGILTK